MDMARNEVTQAGKDEIVKIPPLHAKFAQYHEGNGKPLNHRNDITKFLVQKSLSVNYMRNEIEGSKIRGNLSEQWQEPQERVTYIFSNCLFFQICTRNRIIESYGSSVFILRNRHIVFHSGGTNLHFQNWTRVPFFPHPLPTFVLWSY